MTEFLTAVLGGGFIALVLALSWAAVVGLPKAIRLLDKEGLLGLAIFLTLALVFVTPFAFYHMGAFLLKLIAR